MWWTSLVCLLIGYNYHPCKWLIGWGVLCTCLMAPTVFHYGLHYQSIVLTICFFQLFSFIIFIFSRTSQPVTRYGISFPEPKERKKEKKRKRKGNRHRFHARRQRGRKREREAWDSPTVRLVIRPSAMLHWQNPSYYSPQGAVHYYCSEWHETLPELGLSKRQLIGGSPPQVPA